SSRAWCALTGTGRISAGPAPGRMMNGFYTRREMTRGAGLGTLVGTPSGESVASTIRRGVSMSRLLVIEDQKKLLQSLERGLSEEGYEVIPAMTGEEGYLQAKSLPVDAIVLDLMLPERDGLDVLRSLRHDGFTKPI